MTDQEVIQAMTAAMRTLNLLLDRLKRAHASVEVACPVCDFAKQVFGADIETVEKLREMLIETSRSPSREEKLIAHTKAMAGAVALTDKALLVKTMTDIAHRSFEMIANARINGIAAGREGASNKELLKKALRDAGLHDPDFDPTKVN